MRQNKTYLESLNKHISYVREAGEQLGVPHSQLLVHDETKFSSEEFEPYANYFYKPDGSLWDDDEKRPVHITRAYDYAWLHHMNHNKHHWQYWVFPDAYNEYGHSPNGAMEMPSNYVYEMVADWMGASKAYTGSWDMTIWLKQNMGRVILHFESTYVLRTILRQLSYPDDLIETRLKGE